MSRGFIYFVFVVLVLYIKAWSAQFSQLFHKLSGLNIDHILKDRDMGR